MKKNIIPFILMLAIFAFDVSLVGWGFTLIIFGASFGIAWLWGGFGRKNP